MKLFIAVFLLLSTLMYADDDEHKEHTYSQHHLPLDMHYLDLNKQQYKAAKKAIQSFRNEYRQFHKKREHTQKKISRLFLSEDFDTQKFIQLSSALNQNTIRMQANFFLQMHKILTPEQRKRFIHYMEEWEIE